MQSWHNRPIHWQSVENWEISVQSEIKPNLTAVRQVWAQTGGQAQAVARGSSAILSVPRNRQNELLWVVTILPQSRPQYLQSGWLRLDSGFWGILMQFRQIALRLDRNCAHSDRIWIANRGLTFEPWPQTLAKAGPVNYGRVNLACGTSGTEQRGGSMVVVCSCSRLSANESNYLSVHCNPWSYCTLN